ncbi:MAG: aminoacyl-tRNA hydrolase [Patescibacteria group bacterium]|jgi:PTH1 family peptidyl-tRNA hydrolase
MKLFFGLGNPGKQYQNTRHNLGQMIINNYLEAQRAEHIRIKSKLNSSLIEINKNIFAISTGFMNESGIALQKVTAFYKISPENIYIIHDDLDLPVGEWRLQFDRGPAGHNGVKSVIENLGTQAFWRIRVGIGKPEFDSAEQYVLKPFSKEEKVIITETIDKILKEISNILIS